MTSDKYSIHYDKPKEDYQSYTDTSFVTGDSPVTLDVEGDLGRPTYNGEVNCDGSGNIYVAINSDDSTFGDNILLKAGEKLNLKTHKVWKLKITWISNSSYRVRVW